MELEPEPVELEPESVELEPEPVEPEPVEPEPLELLDVLVVWLDPGRARASAPAVTTLATVTVVVVERTLARPRSLAATAWRIPSISACAAHVTHPAVLYSKIPARTFWASYEPGRLIARSGGRGYPGNMTGT